MILKANLALACAACSLVAMLSTSEAVGQGIIHTYFGTSAGDDFGRSVAWAGDLDGDGHHDVVIGASQTGSIPNGAGYAEVYSSLTGAPLCRVDGIGSGDHFGWSVSGGSDVDNDGTPDFAVGGYARSAGGYARIYSGLTGFEIHAFSGAPNIQFGVSVSLIGDVDHDGFGDLLVGASEDNDTAMSNPLVGSATVFSGLTGSILAQHFGSNYNDRFGIRISGIGDVNADGFVDYAVGAKWHDDQGSDEGSISVFSGIDHSALYLVRGDASDDYLGSVSGAGDVNNDGKDDFIGGASSSDLNGFDAGLARVYSGNDASELYTFLGNSAGDGFGGSVGLAGDLNADGTPDLIVGAAGDDLNDAADDNAGSARLISGLDGSTLCVSYGDAPGVRFGSAVAGAGDADNDSPDHDAELIVGAPFDSTSGTRSGSARLYDFVEEACLCITGISPNEAETCAVTSVTINGCGFVTYGGPAGAVAVTVGNVPCSSVQVVDNHTIVCDVPAAQVNLQDDALDVCVKFGTLIALCLPDEWRYMPNLRIEGEWEPSETITVSLAGLQGSSFFLLLTANGLNMSSSPSCVNLMFTPEIILPLPTFPGGTFVTLGTLPLTWPVGAALWFQAADLTPTFNPRYQLTNAER